MERHALALLVVAALAVAAYPTLAAPPGPPVVRDITLTVEPFACATGTCLGYDGQVPGPTLDVNLGDTLRITLVNHHSEPVSWHVHGTALAADMDGIAAHPGTQLAESVAPPGGSFTYVVRAAFAGSWHYHDHVLGPDGSEGVARGLYGGLVVRNGAEPRADHLYDLHMITGEANGGRGVFANISAGDSFEVLVVGLGNGVWPASLRAPGGATIDSTNVGPGMSDRFRVDSAAAGAYTLRGPGNTVGRIGVAP